MRASIKLPKLVVTSYDGQRYIESHEKELVQLKGYEIVPKHIVKNMLINPDHNTLLPGISSNYIVDTKISPYLWENYKAVPREIHELCLRTNMYYSDVTKKFYFWTISRTKRKGLLKKTYRINIYQIDENCIMLIQNAHVGEMKLIQGATTLKRAFTYK